MNHKHLILKLPLSITLVLCTKGGYFLGAPLFAVYYYFSYKGILNSKNFTEHDKGLFKKTPYCIAIATFGGVFELMFIFALACLWYFYFIISVDPVPGENKSD
ncbi:hypothetical protein A7985_09605 [Pseudoalteromonas luteoviolacea]|uniref:Uncharacterized protein n=1 Tax=Pseudoalteromonas luteoviolacea TaxID=43657 RepID=A0A1C0TS39_9GAMM|nr:hypothetical protein [Pseudoalteromonas luteoviolacea]OCQ22047.1 hypothetical protein A7985_09605 [Pseudoalteromonas luteoviolacea]